MYKYAHAHACTRTCSEKRSALTHTMNHMLTDGYACWTTLEYTEYSVSHTHARYASLQNRTLLSATMS